MNRREFTASCIACIGGTLLAPVMNACQAVRYTTGTLEKDGIRIPLTTFAAEKNTRASVSDYVIIRNDDLKFPICLYRFADGTYTALWMQCSHQGNELQASGDHLHCTAHGSEFNSKGNVVNGPAENNLRSFPVTADNQSIFIDLRA